MIALIRYHFGSAGTMLELPSQALPRNIITVVVEKTDVSRLPVSSRGTLCLRFCVIVQQQLLIHVSVQIDWKGTR